MPGDIKVVSVEQLKELQEHAGNGRPAWLAERGESIQWVRMVVQGTEGEERYRCIAIVATSARNAVWYPIDVARAEFHALPDVPREEVVRLAHQFLWSLPMVPLDPAQQEVWDGRVNGGET